MPCKCARAREHRPKVSEAYQKPVACLKGSSRTGDLRDLRYVASIAVLDAGPRYRSKHLSFDRPTFLRLRRQKWMDPETRPWFASFVCLDEAKIVWSANLDNRGWTNIGFVAQNNTTDTRLGGC